MLKRRALLIQNPGLEGKNLVPTVSAAYERFKSYLKSPVGGWWSDNEILELNRLNGGLSLQADFVFKMREINSPDIGYSMIVFIGHGAAVNGSDSIQLEDGEICPIADLLSSPLENPIKRTVIIDACRNYISLPIAESVIEQRTFSGAGMYNGVWCRDYYNKLIEDAPYHCELVQSTQYDQCAASSQEGTAFTDAFFRTLHDGHSVWATMASMSRHGEYRRVFMDIMDTIRGHMSVYNQVPQISSSNGNASFPIYAMKRCVTRTIDGGQVVEIINE